MPLRGTVLGDELTGQMNAGGFIVGFTARQREDGGLDFLDESGSELRFLPADRAQVPASDSPSQSPPATGAVPGGQAATVIVNGMALSREQVNALLAAGLQVQAGRYWYDRVSGAWGFAGGPTMGFLLPGLALGGPLAADASNGTTGVVINGRVLPPQDLLALQTLTGPLQPGRYFIDGNGNAGYEGGPPLINLRLAAAEAAGGSWQSGITGASGGYDGQGSGFVMLKDSLGRPTTVGY